MNPAQEQPLGQARKRLEAFTLPEALIATTLLLLLLGGIVTANLFGMRMFQMTQTRLQAADGARRTVGLLAEDIRKSRGAWIGNVTNGTFVGLLDGEVQTGGALLLHPTTNATNFICYFLNPADQSFRRAASGLSAPGVLAQTVTNAAVFRAQDSFGNVLTNSQNNQVIHFTLDFYQPQPWLPVPAHSQLETTVARRLD
jgi:hypothetical protein